MTAALRREDPPAQRTAGSDPFPPSSLVHKMDTLLAKSMLKTKKEEAARTTAKLFSEMKTELQTTREPEVHSLMDSLFTDCAPIIAKIQSDPTWDWKKHNKAGKIADSDDTFREKMVQKVWDMAIIFSSKKGIQHVTDDETNGLRVFGTKSKDSDIDAACLRMPPQTFTESDKRFALVPNPVLVSDDGTKYKQIFRHKDNATHDVTSKFAKNIYRALFGSTPAVHLDAQYYAPHQSEFMHEHLTSEAAKRMESYTGLMAVFLQFAQFLNDEEKKQLQNAFKERFKTEDPMLLLFFLAVFQDALDFEALLQKTEQACLDRDIVYDILCLDLTEKMKKPGDKIDTLFEEMLKDGIEDVERDKAKVNREHTITEYGFIACVRSRFYPESYFGKAYNVVCKDKGSQQHQLEDHNRERIIKENIKRAANKTPLLPVPPKKSREKSSPQSLIESFGENLAYVFHKTDMIDAAKYIVRVLDAGLKLLGLLKNVHLKAKLEKMALEISLLASAKRGKFQERAFACVATKYATGLDVILGQKMTIVPEGKESPFSQIIFQFEMRATAHFPDIGKTIKDNRRHLLQIEEKKVPYAERAELLWKALLQFCHEHPKVGKVHNVFKEFFAKAKHGGNKFVAMSEDEREKEIKAKLAECGVKELPPKLQSALDACIKGQNSSLAKQFTKIEAEGELIKMKKECGIQNDTDHKELFRTLKLALLKIMAEIYALTIKESIVARPENVQNMTATGLLTQCLS